MQLNFNDRVLSFSGRTIDYLPSTPYALIDTIATYLRGYMSDFRNPSFYVYRLDGNGFYIDDGGGDMFDLGNVTTPWLRSGVSYSSNTSYSIASYPFAINYTQTTSRVVDTDFNYASLGYIQYTAPTQSSTFHPLTVIGSRATDGQPVGWQVGGNSGADGSGLLASGLIYSGESLSGFTVYSFFREQYSATDPSHCNLYILLGHSNWSSGFGNISFAAQPVNLGGCGGFLYSSGSGTKNLLAIQTLLSKQSGVLVTSGECQTVVQNFVRRIKESLNY